MSKDYIANRLSVAKLPRDAHWGWMGSGWATFKNSLRPSFIIGAYVVGLSWALILFLYAIKFPTLIPAAYGGFILIGPLIATFIYAISREVEKNGSANKFRKIDMAPNSKSQLGFIGFSLFFVVVVWLIFAHLIWSMAVGMGTAMDEKKFLTLIFQTSRGITMLIVGTAVGGVLATICFAISAISLPLVFERDIDALSAMAFSVMSVIKNPMQMAGWGIIIILSIVLSAMVLFLPMIIVFPWLGHVAWHGYKELIIEKPL